MKIQQHHGCSIISDIDDTIKISEVPNKKKLMINTFKKDFKAVPGYFQFYLKLYKNII
jgi:phosphatidate phosphatase APP1